MTKVRAPLSIDEALARIAGQVGGWGAMAKAVGYEERTVRKWGDEDAEGEINVKAMIVLDRLHQQHGGTGFPLYDAYGRLLGASLQANFSDKFELLRRLIGVAKETGDAEAALIRYALPDSSEAERTSALREVVEALDALQAVVPLLQPPVPHERGPPA